MYPYYIMLGIVVVVVSYTTSSILYGSLITFWDIIRKNTCDSRAPLGLLRPRGGSTPFPTAPLRLAGERTGANGRLGEREPPREGSAHSPGWRIIVNTWKSQRHCNSVCIITKRISCCTLLYCCSTSWVGRLVRWWAVGSVCGWVGSVGG